MFVKWRKNAEIPISPSSQPSSVSCSCLRRADLSKTSVSLRPPGQCVSALSNNPLASHASRQPTEWKPFLFTYIESSLLGALMVTWRREGGPCQRGCRLCTMCSKLWGWSTWTQSSTPSTPGNPATLWNCSVLEGSLHVKYKYCRYCNPSPYSFQYLVCLRNPAWHHTCWMWWTGELSPPGLWSRETRIWTSTPGWSRWYRP